jgi:hypothetical protein
MTSDGVTYEEAPTCDGLDEYIIANMFCTVPMSVFIADPFSIPQGELLKIRVSAKNSLGFGIASTLSTSGATAKYIPHKPINTPTRGDGTSQTSLVIDYSTPEGETTGGSDITSL